MLGGRTAVVTGSTSGIGLGIARALASEGADIVLNGSDREGKSKVVKQCSLPLTAARPVSLVVSELAVIDFPCGKARLLETAPGVTVQQVLAHTEGELIVPDTVETMVL